MPKILEIAIKSIMKKNPSLNEVSARKIAISTMQKAWNLKKWTIEATKKWEMKWQMTARERLKARINKK